LAERDIVEYLGGAILGLIEGLTEFLPISSTGHLILAGDLLGFQGPPGRVFEVAIQLGAILAIGVVYFRRLADVALGLPHDPAARRFTVSILLAFLPAAVLGALLHGFIKAVLFSPWVVSVALIAGGAAILLIERRPPAIRFTTIERFPLSLSLGVGFCQCLALVPGVSRSGATILGAVLLGVDRRAATEFSFFVAIPTMLGATVYDLYQNRDALGRGDIALIALGFLCAFAAALVVVRWTVGFVGRHGFALFGWYRIAIGGAMLTLLALR
jgi:undecaprenyl-diphosphatase